MIQDFGKWGNGPEDPYTPPERMRKVYFTFNSGGVSVRGIASVPNTWSLADVRRQGMLANASDLSVSWDVLLLTRMRGMNIGR